MTRQPGDRPPSRPEDDVHDPHTVTALALLNDILRRRRTVLALIVACALVSFVVRLGERRTYTASASFVAESVRPLRRAAVGIGAEGASPNARRASAGTERLPPSSIAVSALVGTSDPAEPVWDPEVYWTMLQSRQLLLTIAAQHYTISSPQGSRSGTLADMYELPPAAAALRLENAARRLARELTVTYDEPTAVMTVSVRTGDPALARELVRRLLDEVMAQNRRMADTRAAAQVAFLTKADAEARSEVLLAEDRLARFRSANRAFRAASRLALEHRRLDADVLEKRQRRMAVALELERAKLDRSRATQVIFVVRRPELPPGPDSRALALATISGAIGGGALALLIVLTSEQLRRLRAAGSRGLLALSTQWRRVGWRRAGPDVSVAGAAPLGAGPEG